MPATQRQQGGFVADWNEMLKALVAEDEMLIRQLILEDLTDAGFTVTAVGTGDDALALIEQGADFHLLFTDIRMPGEIDGWELGRRARALLADVRVIYATGYGDDGTSLADHERKITKPYRYEEILGTLKQLELI
jgi:CheY-like chemotaxis protein